MLAAAGLPNGAAPWRSAAHRRRAPWVLASGSVFAAPAIVAGFDDVAVMAEPVESAAVIFASPKALSPLTRTHMRASIIIEYDGDILQALRQSSDAIRVVKFLRRTLTLPSPSLTKNPPKTGSSGSSLDSSKRHLTSGCLVSFTPVTSRIIEMSGRCESPL